MTAMPMTVMRRRQAGRPPGGEDYLRVDGEPVVPSPRIDGLSDVLPETSVELLTLEPVA